MDYANKSNDDEVSRSNHSSSFKNIIGRTELTIFAHKYSWRERMSFS